ncbi:MAG: transcription antitermination protein NusB [Flavobacteriales bacterium]|nr:transcription antitermination protein NusB [Flavobacteriales bacterium]
MLNRRYLRIKVYQALYAFWQSDGGSAAKVEKEMFLSIERTFDLYVQLMLLFGELHRIAGNRIMDRKQKHLPTAQDLAPNMRFVENTVLVLLSESKRLLLESEKRKLGWMGQGEMLNRMYKEFEESEAYKQYMAAPTAGFGKDQEVILRSFLDHISDFEPLHDYCETKSIYWLEDLDLACSLVKRSIETLKSGDTELALSDLDREPKEEREFVTTLFRKTIDLADEHEKEIGAKAANWEADRIALSDMILMKMALAEVKCFDQIPVKVTMNEYIEIAKAYSTPKSKNFINGILDKLFAEGRDSGVIRKVGRGLLEN